MTITYPLELPSYRATDTDFNLTNVDAYNALGSGSGFATEIAPPYWDASVSIHSMANLEQGYWDGFFDKLRGQKKSFLMYDANRPTPITYPNVVGMALPLGGSFDGSGGIVSFTDVRTVNANGFPANFQLITGDYISFVENGKYSLHRVSDDALGDSNGAITIPFEPYVNTDIFDTSAVIWVYHAKGEFILKAGSAPSRARNVEMKPVSFAAVSRVQ